MTLRERQLVVAVSADFGREDEHARTIASLIGPQLGAEDELARVGPNRFAILAAVQAGPEWLATLGSCRRALAEAGLDGSFGWAVFPDEGDDTLSLFSTAIERLHGSLFARGSWNPPLGRSRPGRLMVSSVGVWPDSGSGRGAEARVDPVERFRKRLGFVA